MILHCKEFTIDDYKILAGHDRESGKRYLLTEVNDQTVYDLPDYLTNSIENIGKIKSIFWLK